MADQAPWWHERLTDAERAKIAADPELRAMFDADARQFLSEGPRYVYAWKVESDGYSFDAGAVLEGAEKKVRRARREAARLIGKAA